MQYIKSTLKYGSAFTSGLLIYHFYETKEHDKQYSHIKTEMFQKAIDDGNMYTPSVYKAYSHINKFDQFFEKLILRKLSNIAYKGQSLEDLSEEELKKMRLNVIFNCNRQLQGHFGILHGGFTSTILDNVYGYLGTLSYGLIPCATGSLEIKFKRPIFVGSEYMLESRVDKMEGRKIFLKSTIIDKKGRVCVESSATMVRVKWDIRAWQFLFDNLRVLHTVKEKFEQNVDIDYFFTKSPQMISMDNTVNLNLPDLGLQNKNNDQNTNKK